MTVEILPDALRRWVRDTLRGPDALAFVSMPSQSDNHVFRVDAGDTQYVLKVIAPGRAHAFAHGRAITDYLASRGFPVAQVIAATTLPDTVQIALLSPFLPGQPARVWYAQADGTRRNRLIAAVATLLARVHRLPLDAVRDLWQYPQDRVNAPGDWATNFVQKKIASDLERIAVALPDDLRAAFTDEITAWGRELATTPIPLAPLHGDYYLDNILWGADGSVTGILDWEAARLGDPMWDLARTEAATFADAPVAFAHFLTVYAAHVPWAVDTRRIRWYRLLMAMGDLRYAVRHAPDLIPERVPPLLAYWRQCVENGG